MEFQQLSMFNLKSVVTSVTKAEIQPKKKRVVKKQLKVWPDLRRGT